MRTFKSITTVAGSLAALAQALAVDVPVDTRIDRVTVYREGAMVTRTGETNIAAGAHRLVLRGLPRGIDATTLRVEVSSNAVRLGAIELATINEGRLVAEAERALKAKIEAKTDERKSIEDEITIAETQLKLLDALAANPTGNADRPAVDATNLVAALQTVGASANAARSRIRDARLKLRAIDREIETLNADHKKVATNSKQSTELRVAVTASDDVKAPVAVVYSVDQAEWNWIYQARLDTTTKRVALERQGEVSQSTGEDWKDVQLTLSSARPIEEAQTPNVQPLFVNLSDEEEPVTTASRQRRQASAAPGAGATELEAIVVTGSFIRSAEIRSTQYATEYIVPGRVAINSEREPKIYPIAQDAFAAELVARVVPSASRAAYLEATFKYELDIPIDGGDLQLYRDGVFVGQAETQGFLPGAEVRIPFGADERIRVVVRDEQERSSQQGIIRKDKLVESRQRIELTNYHPVPIPIEVIDRIPVSRNSDIEVEILKGATPATVKDHEGKSGVLLWKVDAQPQKTAAVRHYFSIRYPKDRELESEEGEEE